MAAYLEKIMNEPHHHNIVFKGDFEMAYLTKSNLEEKCKKLRFTAQIVLSRNLLPFPIV